MLYGLYLSATGVMTNAYRQDVIANNIANAETIGFKRDLALFQERRTEAQERGFSPSRTNAMMEALGGGVYASPTLVDRTQGELESTGSGMDVAIVGLAAEHDVAGDDVVPFATAGLEMAPRHSPEPDVARIDLARSRLGRDEGVSLVHLDDAGRKAPFETRPAPLRELELVLVALVLL